MINIKDNFAPFLFVAVVVGLMTFPFWSHFYQAKQIQTIKEIRVNGEEEMLVGASTLFAQNASVQLNLEVMGSYASTSGNLSFNGEIMPDGATCSNNQILKRTGANDWDCATDAGGVSSNSLDFDEFVPSMTLDTATTITNNGFALTISYASISSSFEIGTVAVGNQPLNIQADSGDNAIRIEENSGGEYYDLLLNNLGDLDFLADDGTTYHLRIPDANATSATGNIYSGGLCGMSTAGVIDDDTCIDFDSGPGAYQFFLDAVEVVNYTTNGPIFNDASADIDFQIESNGNTHAFFVDGGNDFVGIFDSTPDVALDVIGAASVSLGLEVGTYASASKYFGVALSNMAGTDGCSAAGDTLNYTATTGLFSCGSDAGGSVASDSLGFGAFVNPLVLDGNSSVSFGAFRWEFNLNSTGDFIISDNDVNYVTFDDSGLTTFGSGASFSAAVTGVTDELVRWGATSGVPPSTSFATFDTRNDFTVLDFGDSSVASKSIFIDVMPRDYDDGALTVYIHYSATSATSGDVVWDVEFDRIGDGLQDIDTSSWATAQTATCTVPGTSGLVDICSITFTRAQADSISKGELMRVRVSRDTTDANDTVTATDIELHFVELTQ